MESLLARCLVSGGRHVLCRTKIIAGLLIGPSVLGLVQQSDFLIQMAEIGVILLMFSAGLETNLKDLMKTGFCGISDRM